MARPKGVKNKKLPKSDGEYVATLMMFGVKFSAKGSTAEAAISGIKPTSARGKGILILEKGNERKEKILSPIMTSRLFGPASSIAREIALKQAAQRFSI